MNDQEKIKKKADLALAKAEKLMDNERPKSAAEEFQKAGEGYYELQEWKIAEQCFFYGSKNWNKIEKYHQASNLERLAATCCLFLNDFKKAHDYYDISAKTMLKSDGKERDDPAILSECFGFLCLFIQGQQDEALAHVKRFKSEVAAEAFNNHMLVKLVKNLTNAIVNEKEQYIQEILTDFPKYKFRAAEGSLIKNCVILAFISVYMKFILEVTETELINDTILEMDAKINSEKLKEIQENPILAQKIKSIAITDIALSLGDNISLREKPNLPVMVDMNSLAEIALPFKLRTTFPGRGFIGPFMITLEIDKLYHLFIKSDVKNIMVVSPEAQLKVELIPLKPPVINQTFDTQVVLTNMSEGEAIEIDIEFEIPEQFRMMRGVFKKNVYALRPNETMKWEIQLKSLETGEFPIKTTLNFKDPLGNEKGPIEIINSLEING